MNENEQAAEWMRKAAREIQRAYWEGDVDEDDILHIIAAHAPKRSRKRSRKEQKQ